MTHTGPWLRSAACVGRRGWIGTDEAAASVKLGLVSSPEMQTFVSPWPGSDREAAADTRKDRAEPTGTRRDPKTQGKTHPESGGGKAGSSACKGGEGRAEVSQEARAGSPGWC